MYLEEINSPTDLKKIPKEKLPVLAEEIRRFIVDTVSQTGGHLAASLGAVDLIIALHYVFSAPEDKIVFDVGHQAYAHKIITGRRQNFSTLRTFGGISGFPNIWESVYDAFGTGHSSTAISAALGMAVARDLAGKDYNVVAVVGDGALTGGIAFEGLQNAGYLNRKLLVILNDNEMFISHRVGAVAEYLTKLLTLGMFQQLSERMKKFFSRLHFWGASLLRIAKRVRVLLFPGMLFEELGFVYLGPVDGHNISEMIEILQKVKTFSAPVLLHVITRKGKGFLPAEQDPVKFHGVGRFRTAAEDEVEAQKISSGKTYTEYFSEVLIDLAKQDKRIVAITAAMPQGTGLDKFADIFPERFFDVGIAEQHALTFAAGLAISGFRPVCAIYSTFLQRGFDQLIHDIALQNLPVVVAIDRAGIVGEDGATHQGNFDISYLRLIPNLIVMAPADENELKDMLYTALRLNCPVAIRYPKGIATGQGLTPGWQEIPVGKSQLIQEGQDLTIIALGTMVQTARQVSMILENDKISSRIINLRFAKPLPEDLAITGKLVVTLEENTFIGGIAEGINSYLLKNFSGIKVLNISLPDMFIPHGSVEKLKEFLKITPEQIAEKIRQQWQG